jgi:hypothetical protein
LGNGSNQIVVQAVPGRSWLKGEGPDNRFAAPRNNFATRS